MSPMQRCFSNLVCQPLVTSYVIDAYLCLAMLHAWTLEYQHMHLHLTVDIPTKGERQWPAGEDRRVTLTTSSSAGFRRMPTLYCSNLRCGDLRSPGPQSGAAVNSDYVTTTMMMKDDLYQKWRVKLIFKGTYRLFRTGIVECLKIIDADVI